MLVTAIESTLAAMLANPASSSGNVIKYIGFGTDSTPVALGDTTLSTEHVKKEVLSFSVSGSRATFRWELGYDEGNNLSAPIREVGLFTADEVLIARRIFPLTDKTDRTRIYGKWVVDLPIVRIQREVPQDSRVLAFNDLVTLSYDAQASGNVLSNDVSEFALSVTRVNGGTDLVSSQVSGSAGGVFTLEQDGSWSFDTNDEFNTEQLIYPETVVYYTAEDSVSSSMAKLAVTVVGPCLTIEHPASLVPGQSVTFTIPCGLDEGEVTTSLPPRTDVCETPCSTYTTTVAELPADDTQCYETFAVAYPGRAPISVQVPYAFSSTVFTVTGPSSLSAGSSASFTHNLGEGAVYTGTLELVSSSAHAFVLKMPEDTTGSYTASWTATCGRMVSSIVYAVSSCNSIVPFEENGNTYFETDGKRLQIAYWYTSDAQQNWYDWTGLPANCVFFWNPWEVSAPIFSFGSLSWYSGATAVLFATGLHLEMYNILNVTNCDPCASLTSETGTVVGEATLEPGESASFVVHFDSGNYDALAYTGTLELISSSAQTFILKMPEDATGSYIASWTASCGRIASMSVSAGSACGYNSCEHPAVGSGCPSGTFCFDINPSSGSRCISLTGEELYLPFVAVQFASAPVGQYTTAYTQDVWYGAPMVLCRVSENYYLCKRAAFI